MRRYELMLLLRPDLEDDKLQSAVEKVTRAIVNGGGSLSKVSPWGKRRLAYDIQNFREASYFLIHFDIEPSAVREIERGMLLSEEILRHLVTLLEERPGAADEDQVDVPAAADAEDAAVTPGSGERSRETVADDSAAADAEEAPGEPVEESTLESQQATADESEPAEAEPATSSS